MAVCFGWMLLYVYLGFLSLEREKEELVREKKCWEGLGEGEKGRWRAWEGRRGGVSGGNGDGDEEERGSEGDPGPDAEEEEVHEFWAVDGRGECVWVRRVRRRGT